VKLTYFKRYRMEIDLDRPLPAPPLPAGYRWLAWDDDLIEAHAEAKFASFHDEIDSSVFPSLSSRDGCLTLMRAIRQKAGFLPCATWLVADPAGEYCATVQGLRDRGRGAIQNLGVTRSHRGTGLGTALLCRALAGFRQTGLRGAFLEVTARNESAIRLYRRLGFRCRKTVYKAVGVVESFVELCPPLLP
jgi:ribosomal protein S18 acetylase RimI-like enzyme